MASDKPTGGNIQHSTLVEHNTSAVPGAMVVDVDGAAVADAGGAVVVDVDGTMVADEDTMPITTVDYRRPMPFVSRGLALWSSHFALLGVHRASPYPTA